MRKLPIATLGILTLLTVLTAAGAVLAAPRVVKTTTITYTPRPGAGPIFAVFDFPREAGRARPAPVTLEGGVRRTFIAVPYGQCERTVPAGFVIKLKQAGEGPLKITTTGTLLRAPYQGDPPLELLHACYRIQK